MFRRKPAPHLMRGGHRFADKNMRQMNCAPTRRSLLKVKHTKVLSSKIPKAVVALPSVVYVALALVIIAALACKVGTRFSFNVNEGWNAYWAKAAWSGADLYPPLDGGRLNNYLPLWFYLTGALGALIGDNVRAGRALAAIALLLDGAVIALM